MKKNIKKYVNKNFSNTKKLFTDAINYDALIQALNDPQAYAELTKIFNKVKY